MNEEGATDPSSGPPPLPTPRWSPPPAAASPPSARRPAAGPWSPPDPTPAVPVPTDVRVEVHVEPDGPPVPPPIRRRRRRRRIAIGIAVGVVALVGIAVAAGLLLSNVLDRLTDVVAGGAAPAEPDVPAAPGAPDVPGDAAPDASLPPLDPDVLGGVDAAYARLLTDIDASERVMMAFQDDVMAAVGRAGGGDAIVEVGSAAGRRHAELQRAREPLAVPVGDAGVEEVRAVYLRHLDAWAGYLDALREDPELLLDQLREDAYTLDINLTASLFARLLEANIEEGVHADVRAYATALLDRGFRFDAASDV